MRTIYKRAGRDEWHGKVKLGGGRMVELRLSTDREVSVTWHRLVHAAAARRAANEPPDFAQLEKAGVPRRLWEQAELVNPLAEQRQRSWKDHVSDYAGELRTASRSAMYVYNADKYLREIGDACGWRTLSDADRDDFARFIADRRRPIIDPESDKTTPGAGVRTLHNIRCTLRSFLKWAVNARRVERDALDAVAVETGDVRADRRRIRRALTDAEVAKLLVAVTGTDRHTLYRVALATGLRRREMSELQWRDVQLEKSPCLTLRPEATKSKRADVVPLADDIAECLKALKRLRPFAKPQDPVFPAVPGQQRWQDDLTAAGIAYADSDGRIAGFHSLRVTLGSRLERLGAPIKARMEIMRHTDPKVSYGPYADATLLDLRGVVNSLPANDPQQAETRTGTDDMPAQRDSDAESNACRHGRRQKSGQSRPKATVNDHLGTSVVGNSKAGENPMPAERKSHPDATCDDDNSAKRELHHLGLEPRTR